MTTSNTIDATREDDSLGRLVNDENKNPNCKMKKIIVQERPHLCLFATRDIVPGEEIAYDYGGSDWPWRRKSACEEDTANMMDEGKPSQSASDPVTNTGASVSYLKMQEKIPDYSDDLFDSSESSVEDNGPDTTKARKLEQTWAGKTLRKRQSSHLKGKSPDNLDQGIDSSDEQSDYSEGSVEEYIPDTEEDSDDSTVLSPLSNCKKRPLASPVQISSTSPNSLCLNSIRSSTSQTRSNSRTSKSQTRSDTLNSHSHDTTASPDSTSFVDQESSSVFIPAISKKSDGGRMYDKKQHCLFCGLASSKFARHLERKHSNEVDVAKALSHPKGSKERRMQLEYLRNKGNFEHNSVVLKTGKGKMVPRKLPKQLSDGEDFIPCVYCQGLFLKKTLWRHVKVCKFKPCESTPKPGKTRVQALCSFAKPPAPGVTDGVWKLLSNMNQDRVALAVRNDQCIIEFGNHLYNKYGSQVKMHEFIRQKMRELGRLLMSAQEVTPLKSVKDLICPENFMHTVTAVKQTAGYNKDTDKYKSPSVAVKLGHSLNRIAMLVESTATIKGDKATAEEANSFQKIYSSRWHEYISATARRTLEEAKWNSPQLLPFTEDVKRLHLYLDKQEQYYRKLLSTDPSSQHWSQLAKVTLTQIMLFNRRREGEVSHMPLSAYTSRAASDLHPDVCLALSELEKKLCQHFKRIEIRGKRGRKVAVLVTPTMQESLDLLIQNRSKCGVLQENIYLFARPFAMTCFRGSDCIRDLAKDCGVKNPSTLTSTKLRKQIGTLSEVLNLSNAELDQLADFLGHDIRVHRQFYRLPEGTLQLAKLSKVLLAFEKGRLAEFKGMNLDDISIDPDGTVHYTICHSCNVVNFVAI
ncbi:hypothetical protein NFI96_028811 [Prochilodus magdalenae]|nr:hypothetical protein NFI96_028811 [Prochilodus magdalenae]